jgi:hypothetical protein
MDLLSKRTPGFGRWRVLAVYLVIGSQQVAEIVYAFASNSDREDECHNAHQDAAQEAHQDGDHDSPIDAD